jgi:hypothetical protein
MPAALDSNNCVLSPRQRYEQWFVVVVCSWCALLNDPAARPCARKNRHEYRSSTCQTLAIKTPTPSPRAISTPSTALTMSLAASRAVLRQSTFAVRRAGLRNASTTSEAAGAVKEKASQASSKASEGLTKVTSSASSAASKASEAASETTQKASGMMGTVQG